MSSNDDNQQPTEHSQLWKLSSGKNGEKYLTFSAGAGRATNSARATSLTSTASNNNQQTPATVIRVYSMRWYILSVICFANIANSINWINYSSIADYTGQFYGVDYNLVNFLSLIYLIMAIIAGFFSFWLIDNFGIRTSINLGAWFNFIGSVIRMLSSIDAANGQPLIEQNNKYTVLMIGQSFCALAQPFIMFVTTKFANTWFADDQRALANTLALGSNTLGILIGAFISPQIVNSSVSFVSQMCLLNLITCGVSLVPALMACFVMRSNPPSPPSYSAMMSSGQNNDDENEASADQFNGNEYLINENASNDDNNNGQLGSFWQNFKKYLLQVSKLLKSKDFFILFVCFGCGLGLFNALTTLIEQILCVRGYTDDDAGYFGGAMIVCGLVGCILSGIVLDKTKKFEEVSKICFCMCSLACIFFTIIQLYLNDNSTIYYLMLFSFCIIGFFGLPLLPVCMEMAVECVYPIPEATTTGLLFIAGQIVGIIMIAGYPKVATPIDPNSYVYQSVQTCTSTSSNPTTNATTTTISTTTSASGLSVYDYKYPLYGQTVLLTFISVFFTLFFKCAYLRLRSEREKFAQQIINSARN